MKDQDNFNERNITPELETAIDNYMTLFDGHFPINLISRDLTITQIKKRLNDAIKADKKIADNDLTFWLKAID